MTIRRANVEDVNAIQALLHDTWKDTYGDHLSQATLGEVYKNWHGVDFLTKQVQNPEVYFPIAVENDQIRWSCYHSTGKKYRHTVSAVCSSCKSEEDESSVHKGLGLVPIQTLCHWNIEDKKHAKIQLLQKASQLPIVTLEEGQSVTVVC